MNDQIRESSQSVELVIPEGGLATLLPCWKTLEGLSKNFESSDCSRLIDQESSLEASRTARALVVIHVYDQDPLADLLKRFKGMEVLRNIVITTDTKDKARAIEELHLQSLGRASRLQVEVTPNHGRDVWPFWRVLEKYGADYDYFLKLHLKRSAHWEELGYWNVSVEGKDSGSAWNHDCFDCLIPSSDSDCRSLLKWMRDHCLGALYPRPHRIVSRYGWGSEKNMVIAAWILAELGRDPLILLKPLFFPAGNMFWGAMASFLPLVPFFVDQGHYPLEPIALDGTFLHAVERCYSYLLTSAGEDVGFLFPPQIGADSLCLRGVTGEAVMSGGPEAARISQLSETLHLHRLYTAPACEWRERAQCNERDLLSLKDVLRSVERSRWRKLKAVFRGLFGHQ